MSNGFPNFFDVTAFLTDDGGFRAQSSREFATCSGLVVTYLSRIDNCAGGLQKRIDDRTNDVLETAFHANHLGGR
jgi:hypothetical protein